MFQRLLALGLVSLATPAFAQVPTDLPACYYTDPPGASTRTELPNRVTVELSRSTDADAVEEACSLRVTDATGRVTLSRTAFNARVMPATGNDLDGDGVVDAVFSVDDGGGNRCCWNTVVVSLSTPARVRAVAPEPLGWQFDPERKRFVAEEVVAFYQLGPDMASSPVAIRFHRLGASGFEDVTRDYCAQLLDPQASGGFARADQWRSLSPERRRAARSRTGDAHENEQTGLDAISLALQFHICGRPKDADALLTDAFPLGQASTTRQRVADAVASYRQK